MGKTDPIEDIRIDIENKFNMALADMASEMTYQIESAYESVIQSFYDDYTPRWYERTGSTYQASNKYDDVFGFTPVADGFEAGINVDSQFIPGNPYRADKDWVFDRTFGQGIHGFFKWEYKQWANKQLRDLNKKYVMSKAKKKKLKAYYEKIYKHAPRKFKGNKSVAMIYSAGNISSTQITNMQAIATQGFSSVKPKTMMDRAFKKVTQKKEMDYMFSRCFESYFSR